jgi:hypothetical protein
LAHLLLQGLPSTFTHDPIKIDPASFEDIVERLDARLGETKSVNLPDVPDLAQRKQSVLR